ncbi:TPA: hypothetical protein MI809_24670, partial [Klebsiella pneumoniae]|nr:hypothetical protein [Klebsiella pneumoniae]
MTTDITELAQREKFEAWVMTQICISKSTLEGLRTADGYRNSTLSGTNYNRMWDCWKAAGAELVDALEKAQQENTDGVAGMAESYETTISMLRSRIAELERQNSVLADGVIRAEQWLLESRTVTDWIEHDGKWRPDSLSTDELVYLKTRKQELKIPYPAGKVMGWMHAGGDMDVMAYKLASPQARTVTVKLPELCVGVVQDGHAVMVPYPAGHWFNKT